MPTSSYGQLITFSTEIDADETFSAYIFYRTVQGDTVQKIAAKRGHPEQAQTIAQLNNIRSVTRKLKNGTRLRLPGNMRQGDSFSVLPQDSQRPIVTDGYALYQTVGRPGAVGVNQFIGYDPIAMSVPIDFLARDMSGNGYGPAEIERDIAILEKMAGRGNFKGAASGAPSVIRISVTDGNGRIVPLIPSNYQWSTHNPSAPLWRIGGASASGGGLSWDAGAWSDDSGQRIRQLCGVTITQYTPIVLAERSATRRSKARNLAEGGTVAGGVGLAA